MLEISKGNSDVNDFQSKVYSLKTLHNPRMGKVLALWLLGIFLLIFFCMFLPWQQNVDATGAITSFSPQDRPQEIHSAISGRIKEWRVKEGQYVNINDTLLVLDEIKAEYFDPDQLKRLEEQLTAKTGGIDATQRKIGALDNQITALSTSLGLSLEKARNKVQQARLKLISDSTDYIAQQLQYEITKRQLARYDTLLRDGLISQTDWEKRQMTLQEYTAKMISLQNKYLGTKNELINAQIELNSLMAEYSEKLSKSESDKSSAMGYLADAQGELSKLKNYYANMVIRNKQYYLLAPQDGYVVKALKSGIGEILKENDAVTTIMPSQPSLAAEIYVKAMDVPLIQKGRKVRLEFDGWPALQFSGWPSVSVGTFGGIVSVIDYVDSKDGKFRLLVVPDPDEEGWPRQIRVGSGVYGWIMLNDVPVWYEVWRQLNGFPASLYEDPDSKEDDKSKKSGKKLKIKVKK